MNGILLILCVLLVAVFLYLRFVAGPLALRWLKAAPPGEEPVWRQVSETVSKLAHRQRRPFPRIWVLPEFAPNALVLHAGGRVQLGLTEGLVRALNQEELEAILAVALQQGAQKGRGLRTAACLALFPFALRVQRAPLPLRIFFAPVLSLLLRAITRAGGFFSADAAAARALSPFLVALSLQKLAVLGTKIPLKRWSLALDPLFVVPPVGLAEDPLWLSPGQPSVAERREQLLS